MSIKYKEDFYAWTIEQSNLLKNKDISQLDFENLIDEIETLGRNAKHQLIDSLSLIVYGILKWQYKNIKSTSLRLNIEMERDQAMYYLNESPSLKDKSEEIIKWAYEIGVSKAAGETLSHKEDFPLECPYTFDKLMDNEFYPS